MKISFIALSFALLLIGPAVADACSCGGYPTICEAYSNADAVFIGTVQKVERPDGRKDLDSPGQIAHVQVEKIFKGVNETELIFRSFNTSCDTVYKVGQRRLFYAFYDKKDKVWELRACNRGGSIEDVADDLLYLQALPDSAQKTRISGDVAHYESDPVKRFHRVENMSGVKVKLIGEQKTYEVYTGINGVYEIYGLPPGLYRVEPEIPFGLKLRFPIYYGKVDFTDREHTKVVLKEKGCAGVDFVYSADTSISGKVFGANGRALPKVCLSLQPKGNTVADNWLFDCTDDQGRYELYEIPPGEYIIVVNQEGKISSDQPFPTAYYPGVFEKEQAAVLFITNGNKLENYDIRLPSQAATNVIQGVLLYSDGHPVADEFVEFRADGVKEGSSGEVNTKTNAKGQFSLTVLQGLKGRLYGGMYTYSGEYVNCPQLENLLKQGKHTVSFDIETAPIRLEITSDLQNVKLKFPFPYCAKAKRE